MNFKGVPLRKSCACLCAEIPQQPRDVDENKSGNRFFPIIWIVVLKLSSGYYEVVI